MTISAQYSPDTYAGNGSTDTFAITFAFLSVSTNVKVSIKVDATSVITEKTAGTHYNVSGSNVVFTAGNIPASGETIIIELDPDFTQDSDYTENSNFPAETLEADLDERTLESQFINDQISRSVRVDAAVDISTFNPTLPTPEADKYIGFNGDATAMVTKSVAQLGTLSLPVAISDGGTGSTTAAAAASALGLGTADTPTFAGIDDTNGNQVITIGTTASAVNELTITNAATAGAPSITATGDDTNIGITIDPKGTGTLTLGSADATVAVASTMTVIDEIQHAGDTDNKIGFTTDTQTFTTGGSSRMDITDSGVRLGGANARVTTILDEDTMSSNSATALATQQSIKAYVDSIGGSGKVLQVVSTALTSSFSVAATNAAGLQDVTGLSASITPASTSNKVLVLVSMNTSYSSAGEQLGVALDRASTQIFLGDAASNRARLTNGDIPGTPEETEAVNMVFLDSPSTTSATTYKVQVQNMSSASSRTIYVNRSGTDTDSTTYGRGASTITLLEISGT